MVELAAVLIVLVLLPRVVMFGLALGCIVFFHTCSFCSWIVDEVKIALGGK